MMWPTRPDAARLASVGRPPTLKGTLGAASDEDSLPAELMLKRVRQRLFDVDAAPTRLGRLRLLEVVGRGASGVVYAAHDPILDRKVAVKVFPRSAHRGVLPRARAGKSCANASPARQQFAVANVRKRSRVCA